MKEYIWNGEMDYGWEGLSELLMNTCHKFIEIMLKTTSISPNAESREMITSECMERFESITRILGDIIKDGDYYNYEDCDSKTQNASKLNGWILLGSLTETTLQMFLAFYIDDYKNTKWQQWEEFEVEQVKKPIFECIQKLVDENKLDSKQAKTLKEVIKTKIQEHTKEHNVQKVMLDELIQLYKALELLDEDDIAYLKEIQSNRNGIHSFEHRDIGTWNDLQYSVRFFCYLLEWVIFRLPDISDYEEV